MKDRYDLQMHPRCRQLGSEIPFKYCRTMNTGFPCANILNCWFELIDIVAYLKEEYTEEEMGKFLSRDSRIDIILKTIDKNKQP